VFKIGVSKEQLPQLAEDDDDVSCVVFLVCSKYFTTI